MLTIDILVVDDSLLMQRIITNLLQSDPRIRVVGTAADGYEAIQKALALRPHVITMDIEMPRMDGLTALRQIMDQVPTPVIMLSGIGDAASAVRALEFGAVDFVAKPSGTISIDLFKIQEELIKKIKLATLINLRRLTAREDTTPAPRPLAQHVPDNGLLIAVGASTGGPQALRCLCSQLPEHLPAALLIVQHMPPVFTTSFARRLHDNSPLTIMEAQDGQPIHVGQGYVAPGGRHMAVRKRDGNPVIRILDTPAVNSVRPAADVLMTSVAQVAGPCSMGVVLTGMGRDGTRGLGDIKRAGGTTLAQDQESCVVYGMPKSAIDAGVIDRVVPLAELPGAIVQAMREHECHG